MLLCGLESNNNRLLRLLSTIVVVSILSLVLFTDGPKGVGVDANSCADRLCSHPCSVSPTACTNCHNIDVPAQCGGGGGGGGNGKSSVILVHGNHKQIVVGRRGKRGIAADMRENIRADIAKNKAHVDVHGNHNEVLVNQS